jgi:hypothetical protein
MIHTRFTIANPCACSVEAAASGFWLR